VDLSGSQQDEKTGASHLGEASLFHSAKSFAMTGSQARALDSEILGIIDRWHKSGGALDERDFNDLALRIFAFQLQRNVPYARYAQSMGWSTSRLPESWHEIPAVPTAAYKEATLATFDVSKAQLAFVTSGTTQGVGGRQYMETSALYDAALIAGFDRFMLADGARLRYFNLVPNPAERPGSSLGYMMGRVSALRGRGETGWYIRGDELRMDALLSDLEDAMERGQPVCIAATAFALVHVLDAMRTHDRYLALPNGSRIMETGGFKGRSRMLGRRELYDELCERFGCARDAIVAEYGMTELTSQYYDAVLRQAHDDNVRFKQAPPWLRPRVVGPDGATLPNGTVGALVHVDLGNRSSCVAIQTEDLGVQFDEGLVLIGREEGAALRGCSLDAEDLIAR
jgi:hypothetical protein